MIEKIKPRESKEIKDTDEFTLTGSALKKINQLIDKVNQLDPIVENLVQTSITDGMRISAIKDIVNVHEKEIDKLQMLIEPEKCEEGFQATPGAIKLFTPMQAKEKWVGHLCKFYDDDDKFCFGLLSEIDKGSFLPYCCMPSETWWEHCEVIEPDSKFVFKGDKNAIQ